MSISAQGAYFKDEHGRTLLLRGANLGGSSKVPYKPDGATYRREGFYDHRQVSFVSRPFPLAEADEHLRRLAAWGMTFLRFIVTWEAIEHSGPGEYDEEYLDYLRAVLLKANQYGIRVFIDPHQDVWSRCTGGDGAPGWTLEAVGMDPTKLAAAGAAITHQALGDPFPRMIWPTNKTRYAAATMFTLFFAGETFAPERKIEGVNIQEYLQTHYFNAVRQVAHRLHDLPNVVGYDAMNEPASGFIGAPNLAQPLPDAVLVYGAMPTPFQAMAAASGYPQKVTVYDLGSSVASGSEEMLNPDGVSIWLPGYECPWRQHGVWADDGDKPGLLRPDYFAQIQGHSVDFIADYLKPFMRRFISNLREIQPNALLFLEGAPGGIHPDWSDSDAPQAVNAAHWYDALTLFTKMYNPEMALDFFGTNMIYGKDEVKQTYIDQIGHSKQEAAEKMGGIPTLVGEFGLPFDLFDKQAYRDGDFSLHVQALDNYYDALDANFLSATIWNYTADNTNERGDMWNDEDLSLFSRDQQSDAGDLNSGGRALAGCVRPYALATAGEPLSMSFELESRTFAYAYRPAASVTMPTEIYVPTLQYPEGITVEIKGAEYDYDRERQRLFVRAKHNADHVHMVVRPA
ncbi:MAG: cellulase family glycosylhydrolase [Anaerolineae bacterium]|nr:cellulase family glycosylhydrolase [Anaerolineae bacterium]